MTDTVQERLTDLIVTKMATITGLTGGAYRASAGPGPKEVTTRPAVEVRHVTTQKGFHISDAYECIALYELVPITDQGDTAITDLAGRIAEKCEANIRWQDSGGNYLAAYSWLDEETHHETEVSEPESTGVVRLFVKFYVSRSDATAVKEV